MAIITISRGTYSGGKAVAEQLSERLHCRCLSREMVIKKAAHLFGLDERQLNDAMEEAPGVLRGDIPVSTSNVNYVRNALLREITSTEFVYHGLAGDLLLQGVKKVLRVRIIASRDYRINAAMKDHGITYDQAVRLVENLDHKREKWSSVVLGKSWTDPSLYDVALNLDSISLSNAVDTIEQISRLQEYTADESTEQSLKDLLVSSSVWAALTSNRSTRAVQVSISSVNGNVHLKGEVNSRKLAEAIAHIASEVQGVHKVSNDLNIGLKWLW